MTHPTLTQLVEEACPCKTRRTPPCHEREPLSRCSHCTLRPRILALVERVRRETVEEAEFTVLEQRCERDTPWDLAVLACVRAIRAIAEKGKP